MEAARRRENILLLKCQKHTRVKGCKDEEATVSCCLVEFSGQKYFEEQARDVYDQPAFDCAGSQELWSGILVGGNGGSTRKGGCAAEWLQEQPGERSRLE